MSQQPANNKRASVYSNGDMPSYDNFLSSMQFRFFNQVGVIDIATMNPAFIGKTPKAGDKIYNYEDRVSAYITANSAVAILSAIRKLREAVEAEQMAEEGEEVTSIKTVTIPMSPDGKRKCTITAPGRSRIKLEKHGYIDTSDNYVIRFDIERDGNPDTAYHILQNSTLTFLTVDKEEIEEIEYTGLMLLENFLQQVLNVATGAYRQGAALAAPKGGASSGGKSGASAFSNVLEDDDDEEEVPSDDDEEVTSPAKKGGLRTGKGLTAKRPAANKKPAVKTASLEDEFDEELPE